MPTPTTTTEVAESQSLYLACGASTLVALQGSSGGVFRVDSRGRTTLVTIQNAGTASVSGTVVLYGISGPTRVPIAVCFPNEAGGSWPAFMLSGLPFTAYELEAHGPDGMKIGAHASILPFGGGPPSLRVCSDISRKYDSTLSIPLDLLRFPVWEDAIRDLDNTPTHFHTVTPDDSNDISPAPDYGILLSADGSVKISDEWGATPTLTLVGGVIHRITPRRIYSTGTTGGITIFGVYRMFPTDALITP